MCECIFRKAWKNEGNLFSKPNNVKLFGCSVVMVENEETVEKVKWHVSVTKFNCKLMLTGILCVDINVFHTTRLFEHAYGQ